MNPFEKLIELKESVDNLKNIQQEKINELTREVKYYDDQRELYHEIKIPIQVDHEKEINSIRQDIKEIKGTISKFKENFNDVLKDFKRTLHQDCLDIAHERSEEAKEEIVNGIIWKFKNHVLMKVK